MSSSEIKQTEVVYVKQEGGPTLACSKEGQVPILEEDGHYFKNLSRSGKLEKYEDWRLPARERAEDLAERLSVEEMAGLMAYTCMIHVPNKGQVTLHSRQHTFDGKSFDESGADDAAVSDQVRYIIEKEHMRHMFMGGCQSREAIVEWNNRIQAIAENQPFGIPCIKATDPRHTKYTNFRKMFTPNEQLSVWAEGVGLAATGSREMAYQYGRIVAKELRAIGIQCLFGPQIDRTTEPRWIRYRDTLGPDRELVTELARSVIDGCQTSEGDAVVEDGWGTESICSMVKHWPGGGTGEGGRDAHFELGKYAVYPGGCFEEHMYPFTEGAFKLDGPTKKAGAVMPYYTISYGVDKKYGDNVGNSYSRYIVKDLLRDTYHYDGIVCTDWEITTDAPENVDEFAGKCWGMKEFSTPDRMVKLMMNGVNQIGGIDTAADIVEAYRRGSAQCGEEVFHALYKESAVKLLTNIFRLGMFENPYLDIEQSRKTVGCKEFVATSRKQQCMATVLLKNKNHVLPLKKGTRVYAPQYADPSKETYLLDRKTVEEYFEIVDDPKDAECGLVFMNAPMHLKGETNRFAQLRAGYDREDLEAGGNGYVPISLQYRPYTAEKARKVSIAGNRSYYGKTAVNVERGLDNLLRTRELMEDRPVIAIMRFERPPVVGEFEARTDVLMIDFGVEDAVIMDMLTGERKPAGKLPFTMPRDMEAIETHCEDKDDLPPYVDSEGNVYAVGFGLE